MDAFRGITPIDDVLDAVVLLATDGDLIVTSDVSDLNKLAERTARTSRSPLRDHARSPLHRFDYGRQNRGEGFASRSFFMPGGLATTRLRATTGWRAGRRSASAPRAVR